MNKIYNALISRALLPVLTGLIGVSAHAQDIIINELTQSNISSYMTAKDFPDTWIEFYNPTGKLIQLSNYSVGLDNDDPSQAFPLPEYEVGPWKYVVISCDKNQKEMAIKDKIDSGKGSIYLFKEGKIIETVTLKKMPVPDVSYGRLSDNSGNWGYFNNPTPGKANNTVSGDKVLPQPSFDAPASGVQKSAFSLKIKLPADAPSNASLCVTLDGSEPTVKNKVEAPYKIKIDKSTVVKAKLICDGYLSPRAKTHTYIFPDHDITLGIVSISTDRDYLFSDDLGLLMGDSEDPNANFRQSWRRPVNVEVFINGQEVINQTGEVALSGESSRAHVQKPMKVYAHKRFGEKRFVYPLWDEKPHVTSCKSFMLRNGGSAFTTDHLADEFWTCLFGRNVDLDYQEYRPVVVYLNGEYYGLMDLRERSNDDFIDANYPEIGDIAMVEDWWENKTEYTTQLKDYKTLMNNPETTFEQMCEVADVQEIINYMICEGYPFNRDWPRVNSIGWTPVDNIKWRYLVKDLDAIDLEGQYDFIGYLLHEFEVLWNRNPEGYLFPYKPWLLQPEFCSMLTDKLVAYYGDFIKPSTALEFYWKLNEEINAERKYHFEHYGYSDLCATYWNEDMTRLIETRGEKVFNDFKTRFNYGGLSRLTIDNSYNAVVVNDHKLTQPDFDGYVFGGKAVTLEAAEGSEITGWSVETTDKKGNKSKKIYGGALTFTPDENIELYAVTPVTTGVDAVMSDVAYYVEPDGTIIINGEEGQTVRLLNTQGLILAQTQLDDNGQAHINLPGKGIYILSVNDNLNRNKSYKIAF